MIDSSAIIEPGAKLAPSVKVGPYSYIGANVTIDEGTEIGPHVVVRGPTRIGKHNRIFQFASVGEECQDKKYAGEETELVIGDHNVIREGATLHRGTVQDRGITQIGSHNLFMAYTHVAHDCTVGDHIVMANNAALAGHVKVGDWSILGGFTAVHQFCTIGAHVMCGAGTVVLKDIPAFVMATGNPAVPHGINAEGLKRRGFTMDEILEIRRAYKLIYRSNLTIQAAVQELEARLPSCSALQLLLDSLTLSSRGVIR